MPDADRNSVINIKRLKKDGSVSDAIIKRISACLKDGRIVIMPVDNIYAAVALAAPDMEKKLSKTLRRVKKRFVRLISSFKMLDDLALFNKNDYDFLNRIWPGEVTVIFRRKQSPDAHDTMAVRYPRSKFLLSLINELERPLIFANLYKGITRAQVYRKNDIISSFKDSADLILVVDELCRRHPACSLIDISGLSLRILREGKVPSEEIKSLYFLGTADVPE
jgi:tRNA threonylcarbamoyl adenosine modification protein (Sua5/YciO/YrdC/YwlC family)